VKKRPLYSIDSVAPRAGAWIETSRRETPRRVCLVAPRAGAWIETNCIIKLYHGFLVAPRAGAWIETRDNSQ